MTAVPPEAIAAATDVLRGSNTPWARSVVTEALEAAAPHLAAAVRAEDAPLHNDAIWRQAGAAVHAERERIIQVASQLRATIPADHPAGAQASFADYLRVTRTAP